MLLTPDGLYGNTYNGGDLGNGTVFRIDQTGHEDVKSFPGCCNVYPRGASPLGGLLRDAVGNFYGTTYRGGNTSNYGTVFKLDKTGKQTVLHRFVGTDGSGPSAPLIMDPAGNLYGTTEYAATLKIA